MGEARVVLQLLNADGELTERYFPGNGGTSILQLARNRFKPFHSEESQAALGKQLALFYVSGLRLMIEPSVEGVTIEPPVPDFAMDTADGRIVVNPSKPAENSHHFIHLRPEDIIHFEHHNLQIRYSVHYPSQTTAPPANMPSAVADPEDVQVKSSDPQRLDHEAPQTALSDSEIEDEVESDPDRRNTPVAVTPTTSRVTVTREVKETPKHEASEEDVPFSTAVDQPEDAVSDPDLLTYAMPSSEIELTGDAMNGPEASSPGAQAGINRAERAKRSQEASLSRIPPYSPTDFSTTPSMLKNKYGKRSRRNTPDERGEMDEDENAAAVADQQDAETRDPPAEPKISQTLFLNGRAYEAATRSMSRKRKPEAADENGTSQKSRKVVTAGEDSKDAGADGEALEARTRKVLPAEGDGNEPRADLGGSEEGAAVSDEASAADDDDSDDGGASQVPADPRVSSGKLPRVARAQESDNDEIAVTSKKTSTRQESSPGVVVRPQRASKSASKTSAGTPSSTTTSSLPGRPPKILMSNVAGKYAPSSPLVKFLKTHGSTVIETVPSRRTNFICVVRDDAELMKTPKVLRSLALGKLVVTERWINDCKSAGELLDPADFIHLEVVDGVDLDRRQLFFGKVLYFTNAVVKKYGKESWEEMEELVTEAGASSVESGTGEKGGKLTGRNSIIYIGTDEDADATALIVEHSRVVYHKDLVKEAVVSGQLDLEDEKYRLKATTAENSGRRWRRGLHDLRCHDRAG